MCAPQHSIATLLLLGNRVLILLKYEQFGNAYAWRSIFASCPHPSLGSIVGELVGQGAFCHRHCSISDRKSEHHAGTEAQLLSPGVYGKDPPSIELGRELAPCLLLSRLVAQRRALVLNRASARVGSSAFQLHPGSQGPELTSQLLGALPAFLLNTMGRSCTHSVPPNPHFPESLDSWRTKVTHS